MLAKYKCLRLILTILGISFVLRATHCLENSFLELYNVDYTIRVKVLVLVQVNLW